MSCAVPTTFPTACVTEVLDSIKSGGIKSGATLSRVLYVGSYFAGLLPEGDTQQEPGVLKAESLLTDSEAIVLLEVLQKHDEQGVQQSLDLATILRLLAYLKQLYDLYLTTRSN